MANLAVNKQASFSYELLERFEGGLALTGAEVKAARQGSTHMKSAYLSIENGELWIKNLHISKYAPAGAQVEYDPLRTRKVLVHKKEMRELAGKSETQGLTIVPIRVYTKGDLIKIEFALARGKKSYEKRESIKKRDVERRMHEEVKKTRFGT